LQNCIAALTQNSTNFQTNTDKLFDALGKQGQKTLDKAWNDQVQFKNIKVFSGDARDWEEFVEKFKGAIAASNGRVVEVMEYVETKVSESVLEEEDYA
jgi:cytochrome c556